MPPDYRQYKILEEAIVSTPDEQRKGIMRVLQLVKPMDGPVEIRLCYYTKRQRMDGSEWWGLSPRPTHFRPEDADIVANGILELAEKYMLTKESIA